MQCTSYTRPPSYQHKIAQDRPKFQLSLHIFLIKSKKNIISSDEFPN